jgi:1-acyl-sn-glycerol-3-phosphate acyltransferase
MIWLRSLAFQTAFYVWTVAVGVVAIFTAFGPWHYSTAAARFWGAGVLRLARWLVGIDYRVLGREHLPGGPFILAAKHQSAWDTIVIPLLVRDPAIVIKRELLYVPIYGWVARRAGSIPVDRQGAASALRPMLRAALAARKAGRVVVIFPQGTRVPPGKAAPYLSGLAALYRALDVPVVPAAVNSGLFWPRRGFLRHPGTITFEFLPPIPPGLGRREFDRRLETAIETASQRLLGEARGESPSSAS